MLKAMSTQKDLIQQDNQAYTAELINLRLRKTKRSFLQQVDRMIDWEPIVALIEQYYTKGQAATGRKAYSPLLLFKMSLLQTWYHLSDYAVEEHLNDSLSFMQFCQVQLHDNVPDHSVLSRFRTTLSESGAWDKILVLINKQLLKQGILVKEGAIIDASITPTARKPKGKKVYELRPGEEPPLAVSEQPGVDKEAAWVKKGGKLSYGYKRHYVSESTSGLVLSVETTAANAHESKYLTQCVSQANLPTKSRVYADKGYCSAANEAALKGLGLRSGIQKKAGRGSSLSSRAKQYNKLVGVVRYKIERVFGSIQSWFGGLSARYVGKFRTHGQHVLEALAYNLYRSPGLVVGC